MTEFVENKNFGLSQNFSLTDGKFELNGGPVKALDSIYLWLCFDGFFRVYSEDFPPEIEALLQKTSSYVNSLKGLLLGRMQQTLDRYLPYVSVNALNLSRTVGGDFRAYSLGFIFDYKLEPDTQLETVVFIEV